MINNGEMCKNYERKYFKVKILLEGFESIEKRTPEKIPS